MTDSKSSNDLKSSSEDILIKEIKEYVIKNNFHYQDINPKNAEIIHQILIKQNISAEEKDFDGEVLFHIGMHYLIENKNRSLENSSAYSDSASLNQNTRRNKDLYSQNSSLTLFDQNSENKLKQDNKNLEKGLDYCKRAVMLGYFRACRAIMAEYINDSKLPDRKEVIFKYYDIAVKNNYGCSEIMADYYIETGDNDNRLVYLLKAEEENVHSTGEVENEKLYSKFKKKKEYYKGVLPEFVDKLLQTINEKLVCNVINTDDEQVKGYIIGVQIDKIWIGLPHNGGYFLPETKFNKKEKKLVKDLRNDYKILENKKAVKMLYSETVE